MNDFHKRARLLFENARSEVASDCDAMHASHSAKGLLQSGATAKAAIRIYQARMDAALKQILAEAAKVIDHRGRSWRKAMKAISEVLSEEANLATEAVAKSLKLAGAETGDARKTVDDLLEEVARSLKLSVDEFSEGWTAPIPKRWIERNPIAYAVLLLVAGALIAAAFQEFWPKRADSQSSTVTEKAPA